MVFGHNAGWTNQSCCVELFCGVQVTANMGCVGEICQNWQKACSVAATHNPAHDKNR
jgi:hypothetical protein